MKKILVVIPAYNEEEILKKNIIKLHDFLKENIKNHNWEIIISDNASVDNTLNIAKELSKKYKKVSFRHQTKRPASYAIKKIWLEEDADIYMYMDADLSTDISHTPELLEGVEQGYDIVSGSRNSGESKISRLFHRFIISMVLIHMLRIFFWIKVTDFQCGFKAINRKVRDNILPKMQAIKVGFMDTELLLVANKKKCKIKEIPVFWNDTRKTKAPIVMGIIDALLNMMRIKIGLMFGGYN